MNKLFTVLVLVVVIGGIFVYQSKKSSYSSSYKDTTYLIEGKKVKPGEEIKYFGNELKTDLNGDGQEDIAFIITEEKEGSRILYYAVAAINTERGYIGSDGYLLGDRISPQSTNLSPNPRHKEVVVFNYVENGVGKSVYLKLNSSDMQWGIVEPNFEGESR